LNKYESDIYESLIKYGRSNAKEISKRTAVPPTAVYPNIKTLEEKHLIHKFEGDVGLFEAINPKVALNNYITKKKTDLDSLKKEAEKELNSIKGSRDIEKMIPLVEMSEGTAASVQISKKFVEESKKSFLVIGWRFRVMGNKSSIEYMNQLQKRNVDYRIIITNKNPGNKQMLKTLLNNGVKIKYFDMDNFSIVVKDSKECKISFKNLETTERINLHIRDPDLASFLGKYFENIWKKAKDIRDVIKL